MTIKSIAKDLGISHMTVSRALSDHPNVNKATRDMILNRARELGYVKNAAAKAMRGDGTKIVGLLLPNIINEFYARFANALALACEKNSLHLIIHLTNDDIDQEYAALERLREVQAMAVLMVPAPRHATNDVTQTFGHNIIQLVRERPIDGTSATVLVDDHSAIQEAVAYLAKQGHTEIGYIGANNKLSSGQQRLAAFRAGLATAGLSENHELVHTATPSFEMGHACTGMLLDGKTATALICGGVEISNGALAALMDREKDPHKDIAFIGYGDPSFYAWIAGGISTIKLPIDQLAQQAMHLLQNTEDTPLNSDALKATLTLRP
ncbi:MAG: LacI family DNA-binding transcriptional regulator [Cognatishimia sp.]